MTNPGKWNIFFIYWIFPVVLKKTADQSSDLYDKTCNSYQSLKDPNTGRARDDCASTPEEIPAARSVFSLSDGGEKPFVRQTTERFLHFFRLSLQDRPIDKSVSSKERCSGRERLPHARRNLQSTRTRRKRPCPGASPLKRESVPVSEKIGARRNKCKQGGCDEQ